MNYIETIQRLGKADLHIHSNYSDAKPGIGEILEYVQNKTDLDIIAITDHDTIDGALYAKRLMKKKKYRFELIVGEEISTKEGHVIGLYLNEKITSGLTAEETIMIIKKQGGLVLAPHPLRHIRIKTGKNIIDGLDFLTLIKEKKNIDAIETLNNTPAFYKDNLRASFFNDTFMLKSEIGSSDAHMAEAIGMGFTVFEGKTASDLRDAILSCQTRAFHKKWKILGIIKYLFFFLPGGFRLAINSIFHSRNPKRIQMINLPKKNIKQIAKQLKERSNFFNSQVKK